MLGVLRREANRLVISSRLLPAPTGSEEIRTRFRASLSSLIADLEQVARARGLESYATELSQFQARLASLPLDDLSGLESLLHQVLDTLDDMSQQPPPEMPSPVRNRGR